MGFRPPGHSCELPTLKKCHNKLDRYSTYCYFSTNRPADQPAITGVVFCHKRVGDPCCASLLVWSFPGQEVRLIALPLSVASVVDQKPICGSSLARCLCIGWYQSTLHFKYCFVACLVTVWRLVSACTSEERLLSAALENQVTCVTSRSDITR